MNDDCCFPPQNSQSWIDLQHAKPVDILNLVADAYIGSTAGAFANSSNYGTPGSWATNSFTITSAPTCTALGTDDLALVADAAQWNFQHQTANVASTNAIPLRKVIFLRAGTQWQMTIPVSLGGSTYSDIQLSFLANAATRGDAQGTVPVIQWTGSFTGDVSLKVTLKMPGNYQIGLRAVTGGNTSMFEMEWIVVSVPLRKISLGDLQLSSFPTSPEPAIDPRLKTDRNVGYQTCVAKQRSCWNNICNGGGNPWRTLINCPSWGGPECYSIAVANCGGNHTGADDPQCNIDKSTDLCPSVTMCFSGLEPTRCDAKVSNIVRCP